MRKILLTTFILMTVAACTPPAEDMPETETDRVRLVIGHEVEDYATWRERFDVAVTSRLDAGIEEELILRELENPNLVFVLMTARDSTSAAEWLADPATARSMDFAGVKGELLTELLTWGTTWETDAFHPTRLLVRHPVDNFDRWMGTFRGHEQERIDAGVSTLLVTRRLADRNDVLMMFGVTDPESVTDYMSSELLRLSMRLAGVSGEPQAYFVSVVE